MPRREFVKSVAELTDGDKWVLADLILEEYPAEEFGDAVAGEQTGLYEELEATQTELAREYGIELRADVLRRYRVTAIKWPNGARAPFASFDAHGALRGDDREELMRVYLRKAKREGKKALSRRMVARYRSEDRPAKPMPSWDSQVERAVDSLAKRLVLGNVIYKGDDWWNAKAATPTRRRIVAGALRKMADKLA